MGVSGGATTARIFGNDSRLGGTSLARGTGVTSTDGKSSGDVRGTRHGSSKRKQAEERSEARKERSQVMSTVQTLLSNMNDQEEKGASGSESST